MGTISAKDFDEGYCKAIDDVMGVLRNEDRTNPKFFFPLLLMKRIKKMGESQGYRNNHRRED